MLSGLLFHGCAGIYSVVEFEVLEPATVSLPESVKQLIILNRAPITMDAFEKEDAKGLTPEQLIILDTLIINNLNRGLFGVLQQSPIEEFRYPFWKSQRRSDTTALDDLVLTRREVAAICEEMEGDAILSLESYSLDYERVVEYFSGSIAEVRTRYYEISSKIWWTIYLPGNPRPFDTYILSDTLFFTEVLDGQVVNYHPTARMLKEAFYTSGRRYGRYLVPIWVHTTRSLYRGREDSLKMAARQTDLGDWERAYEIWEDLTASKDSTAVAKAYHNMAIYYELEDNLDSAGYLLNMAIQYDSLDATCAYQEELDIRILNRSELYQQVR
ncbi:MAG: DUF6340 family protein [Bacteroidota bacterium]